jgi:hypothetical protein
MLVSNRLFSILAFMMFCIDGLLGLYISSMSKFASFKFMSILGNLFNITGAILLSNIVLSNKKVKTFICDVFAGFVLWGHIFISIGAYSIVFILHYFYNLPSSNHVMNFVLYYFLYMLLPLILVDEYVFSIRAKINIHLDSRANYLGVFFVFSGLLIQFIGSIKDFMS